MNTATASGATPLTSPPSGAPAILYCRAAPEVTLADALRAVSLPGALALLSEPTAFHLATVDQDGAVTTLDAQGRSPRVTKTPPRDVFEARIFTPDAELRWFATPNGHSPGRAALLTEEPSLLPRGPFTEDSAPLTAVETLPARYLLWGQPVVPDDPAPPGWATLFTARIGALRVPLPPGMPRPTGQQRLRLAAREYVCAEPPHGNASVAEERLLGLESAESEQRGPVDG